MASHNDKLKCDLCGKSPATPTHIWNIIGSRKYEQSGMYCDEHMPFACQTARYKILDKVTIPIQLAGLRQTLNLIDQNFDPSIREQVRGSIEERIRKLESGQINGSDESPQ